ncbi:hypothetical protein QOZ80_9AG0689310 [Eleusine coracana subsp. coracana]|nr:hypothetical protein QOZ80_9AG0689310 [Eleusine coracana subsp. coracana]
MYAVGKVGSLISRSVYTVSGPFHPFGGAVDIVVVQQQDGSFKSSPWYVRFGKFQGVLKTREKVVNISVNGVEAGFHMYLDSNGEAYFLRDADPNGEEGEFIVSPVSSGDEQEAPTLRKSKSTSCDSSTMEADVGVRDNKILARTTTSRRTTILERMFGRKSIKNNAHSVDRSTVVDAGNSDQMETSEILLPEHSSDHGKEMEPNCNSSDCNSSSPVGGRNSSANETDNCLQTTSVKEEVVEIYTHDISNLRTTSTTDQAGSEYLSNDMGTDKSIHESVDTLGGSLYNFEDATGREIHTKEFLLDGVFEIHSVDTEITDGKSEVVSHFVAGDSDGANQNSADTNLPSYRSTDVSNERHEVLSISSTQDVVEDKMIIISSTETVESYAMSTIFADNVHDAGDISLTNGVDVEEHSVASHGTVEQQISEEYRALSNKEDTINVVVQDQADSVLEDLQANGSDMESSTGTVLDNRITNSSHDLACKHDLVCPAASNIEDILMLENVPEDTTKDSSVEEEAYGAELNVSVTQATPTGEGSREYIAQFAKLSSAVEVENFPIITDDIKAQITKNDGNIPLSTSGDEIQSMQEETEETEEKEAYSAELNVFVTQPSPTGEGSREYIAQFANFSSAVEVENVAISTDEIEAQNTKNDDGNITLSTSGDEIQSMQEETEETEAVVSFAEHIEEIQFQFSDTESFADIKIMDEMRANKMADEGEYDESDCDAEEQKGGCDDSANDFENSSVPLIPETSPLPIPGCELHSGGNSIGAKSLPILRSHINDLERSDSVQLSRSLRSNPENNGVEPVKNMISTEQEPEANGDPEENSSGGPEENSKVAELSGNSIPEDKHTGDLKVDSFNPVAELSLCRHLLSEGMGEDAARRAFDSEK